MFCYSAFPAFAFLLYDHLTTIHFIYTLLNSNSVGSHHHHLPCHHRNMRSPYCLLCLHQCLCNHPHQYPVFYILSSASPTASSHSKSWIPLPPTLFFSSNVSKVWSPVKVLTPVQFPFTLGFVLQSASWQHSTCIIMEIAMNYEN